MARDIDPEEIARLLTLKPVNKEDAEQMGMKEHLLKNYPNMVQKYVDRNVEENQPSSAAEKKVDELFKPKSEEKQSFPGLKNLFNKSNEDRKKDVDAFLSKPEASEDEMKMARAVEDAGKFMNMEEGGFGSPAMGITKAAKVFGPELGKQVNKLAGEISSARQGLKFPAQPHIDNAKNLLKAENSRKADEGIFYNLRKFLESATGKPPELDPINTAVSRAYRSTGKNSITDPFLTKLQNRISKPINEMSSSDLSWLHQTMGSPGGEAPETLLKLKELMNGKK